MRWRGGGGEGGEGYELEGDKEGAVCQNTERHGRVKVGGGGEREREGGEREREGGEMERGGGR